MGMSSPRSGIATGLICAVLSAATYGLNPVLAKLGYAADLTALQILHERFFFALLVLLVLGPVLEKDFFVVTKPLLLRSLGISLLILTPMNLLYVYALKGIPASLMSLITYVYPLVVFLLNIAVLHQPFSRRQLTSVFFIIVGCFCIFSDALNMSVDAWTLSIAFLAMVLYAVYLLSLQEFAKGVSALKISFLTILFVWIALCVVHNPLEVLSFSGEQLGISFCYGLVSTVLSTYFLSRAIQLLGATEAGIFCSFEPVFTIVFASLVLGESTPWTRMVGMLCLILGIVVPNRKALSKLFIGSRS